MDCWVVCWGLSCFYRGKNKAGNLRSRGAINVIFLEYALRMSCHLGLVGSGLQLKLAKRPRGMPRSSCSCTGPIIAQEQGDRGGGLAPQVCLGHCRVWVGFFLFFNVCVCVRTTQSRSQSGEGEEGGRRERAMTHLSLQVCLLTWKKWQTTNTVSDTHRRV